MQLKLKKVAQLFMIELPTLEYSAATYFIISRAEAAST